MAELKRTGMKGTYWVLDSQCLGRQCFRPGVYASRGATLSGSRNTGNERQCCTRNAYHGCPNPGDSQLEFSKELAAERKRDGWKQA